MIIFITKEKMVAWLYYGAVLFATTFVHAQVRTDFEPKWGALTVSVDIAGQKAVFLIDTSSTLDVYDPKIEKYMGDKMEPIEVLTHSGSVMLPRRLPPKGLIGGKLPTSADSALVLDCRRHAAFVGIPVLGVLGMSTLSRYVLTIDPELKTIRIDTGAINRRSKEGGLRIAWLDGVPAVEFQFGRSGQSLLQIDTGYNGFLLLNSPQGEQLLREGALRSTTSNRKVFSATASIASQIAEADAIRLGEIRLPLHEVLIGSDVSVAGMEVWRRTRVVFDFPQSICYVERTKWFKDRRRDGGLGFVLGSFGGSLEVVALSDDGIFDASQLVVGDRLIAIGGTSVGSQTLSRIVNGIREQRKSKIRLTVMRGEQSLTVEVRRRT